MKGRAAASPNVSAVTAVGQMIRLGGQRFTNSVRLLDDSEYRTLAANPRLNGVAKQLLSSRKDLTLQWISVLLSDLMSLWRFRRLLRCGTELASGRKRTQDPANFRLLLGAAARR